MPTPKIDLQHFIIICKLTLFLFYRAKLENQIRMLENPHQIYNNQNNETSKNTQVFF